MKYFLYEKKSLKSFKISRSERTTFEESVVRYTLVMPLA